jgi:hypothetical protein
VTRRLKDIWLVVLRRGRFFFGGAQSWDEEEEGEIGEDRVEWEGIYYFFLTASPTDISVCDSIG